jgi:hypothetical protein
MFMAQWWAVGENGYKEAMLSSTSVKGPGVLPPCPTQSMHQVNTGSCDAPHTGVYMGPMGKWTQNGNIALTVASTSATTIGTN